MRFCLVGLHYHLDHLGSVQVITSSSGGVFEYLRYKPYGELRGRWHYDQYGQLQPVDMCADGAYCREFTGYETEPISNLQYAGARFYDPELGMFLTHDPVRSAPSPYGYCGGDPANQTDPNGECLICIIALFVGWETFVEVGSHTGDTAGALLAGAIAGVTAAVGSYGTQELLLVEHPVLTNAIERVAVELAAAGAGGYATYESANHGMQGAAALAALGTVLAAYGAYQEILGAQPVGPGGAQGGAARNGASQQEWENLYEGKLEPAQANVSSDPRAEVVFGETGGLRPQPNDPGSAADLQTAREMIADISERNPNVYSARPNPRNPIEMAEWQHAVQASHAAQQWNLPPDVRHFFLNQAGVGPSWPTWSYGRTPYATYGPFMNIGGGGVPRGAYTNIYIYRGVP